MYNNGAKYEGDWQFGKRHGLGTLWVYHDCKYNVRYNGEWKEDNPNVSTDRAWTTRNALELKATIE